LLLILIVFNVVNELGELVDRGNDNGDDDNDVNFNGKCLTVNTWNNGYDDMNLLVPRNDNKVMTAMMVMVMVMVMMMMMIFPCIGCSIT
jgi:hypothetical protein